MSLSRLLVISDISSNIKAFKDVECYAGTTISSGALFIDIMTDEVKRCRIQRKVVILYISFFIQLPSLFSIRYSSFQPTNSYQHV